MNKNKIVVIILILLIMAIIFIGINVMYKNKIPVLCYHNIGKEEEIKINEKERLWTISLENFEKQMKFIYDFKFHTLTLEEFFQWKNGKKELPLNSVLITFDDALLSNYEYAFDILKKYNINATVFIIGENSNKETTDKWDGNLNSYMGLDLIKMSKSKYPNIEFQSHTYGMHVVGKYKQMKKKEIYEDFNKMKNIDKFEYLVYPFGIYDETFIQAAKDNGIKLAFAFDENRKATLEDDNYKINRINVSTDKPLYKFALRFLLPY